MKTAVIRFPGSNCDQDCYRAISEQGSGPVDYVWHKETSLAGYDLIVLPGGFSYGDYLRCGAIARFSPVMRAVIDEAQRGTLVIGICNGFQILCESGLLPGALRRNRDLHFICEQKWLRVESVASPFTNACATGGLLRIPIAHGEGNYAADEATLRELNREGRVLLRYCDEQGQLSVAANANGSVENIAGICNRARNVFGLMPHPDRACEARLGSTDGALIFQSIAEWLQPRRLAA